MKEHKQITRSQEVPPKRPATPRSRVMRAPPSGPVNRTDLEVEFKDEALRSWFDEEVEALQRLAHTQRLKGDYVAAQFLEREIRQLAAATAAMVQAGQSR